jgi:hypothetical protein
MCPESSKSEKELLDEANEQLADIRGKLSTIQTLLFIIALPTIIGIVLLALIVFGILSVAILH